jgi:hypothetical protein
MNIKLGNKNNYYSQLNDATYYLLDAYSAKARAVACGPNAVFCGAEINGWFAPKYKDLWPEGMQKTDAFMMMLYNPHNASILHELRANALSYPKQEVAQYLQYINYIYNKEVVKFTWACSKDIIKDHLKNHRPVVICGDFPGVGLHYVLIRGCDETGFIYSDSYDIDKSKDYFNMHMTFSFFNKYVDKHFLLYINKAPV